ncbi:hypothetical protein [Litchfieldia alkalitelluris]|uniref:hypothetical protein n=1 Tax=Litchfieldia alkalitelluris TaxID=304268 RepID=UPI0009978D1A|nr:hypothetical protein [Litchfieldia alkalitelluris]
MKVIKVISILFLIFLNTLVVQHVLAKNNDLSEDCIESIELERNKFHGVVMQDVLSSYDIKINEIDEVLTYDINDLRKISILTGKTESHLESIIQQFETISFGHKKLYFFNKDFDHAFVMYKNPQYNNVMVKMKRGEEKWSVEETKVVEGKKIDFKKVDCKDEHIINKGFNGLFKGLD